MPAKRDSPNRRRSIAVPDQNKPAFISRSKRRAHSIVAGDRLSPLARARRSLVRFKFFLLPLLLIHPLLGSKEEHS